MKNLIFSDAHGRSIEQLLADAKKEGVERIIGLGDYDTPEVLRELLESDLKKIVVVGNHDYHYLKGLFVHSELMNGSARSYTKKWNRASYTHEREFLWAAIDKPNQTRAIVISRKMGERRVAFSHSSITKAKDWETDIPLCFWERIIGTESAKNEFRLLVNRNINILFRGHDHYSGVYTYQNDKIPRIRGRFFREEVVLEPSDRHIVCVGAYHRGEYCLFDDKTGIVNFIGGLHLKID